MTLTSAQKKANAKWKANHKEQQRLYQYRSITRRYIKQFAKQKDIDELKELLEQRQETLKTNER